MEKESRDEIPFQPIKDEILDEGAFVNVSEFCQHDNCVLKEVRNLLIGSYSVDDEAKKNPKLFRFS